jgi:hypothetical protein
MATPIESILARRAPYKTPQGRRIRSLFYAFMARLDRQDPLHVAMALRASELQVIAEETRARVLSGDHDAADDLVRLDNTARRAADDLVPLQIGDGQPNVPWTAEQ